MNPDSEMMMWCLAYIHKLTTKVNKSPQDMRDHAPRTRFWPIRWFGYAALRVGTWLLADELQAGVERSNQPQQQTALPRL